MSDITTDELDKLIEELELLSGVHFYDHETLGEAKKLISQYLEQAALEARIEMVESANCILQADEPAIDEIWFDFMGMPMRQDTLLDELQAQLTTNKSKE